MILAPPGPTLKSIAAQKNRDWNCVVVANEGADLPKAPAKVDVVEVNFPRNPLPVTGPKRLRHEAIRRDKGARVLAGLAQARPNGHVMVVDYDDMVSNQLAGLAADNETAHGWYCDDGYLFSGGEHVLYYEKDFYRVCGTSHVLRHDLLHIPQSPAEARVHFVDRWLGSHMFVRNDLAGQGTPLARAPFVGAVYRIGHPGTADNSPDLTGFIRAKGLEEAVQKRNLMRPVDDRLADEFFGGTVE